MARPRKLSLDYFPHDTDAVNDEKVEAIRALFGNDGYAFYFILLERIYRSDNAILDISRFALRAALISKIGIAMEKFDEMLAASFEIGLFDRVTYEQSKSLTSPGIQKRYQTVHSTRDKWRSKKEGLNEIAVQQDIFQGENIEGKENSPGKTPQSKGKKKKENEIKTKYADYVHMTESQYQKLVDQYGPDLANEMITVLDNYKGSKGRQYKDDYRAILSWAAEKVLEKHKSARPANLLQSKNEEAMRKIREAEARERSRSSEIILRDPEYV